MKLAETIASRCLSPFSRPAISRLVSRTSNFAVPSGKSDRHRCSGNGGLRWQVNRAASEPVPFSRQPLTSARSSGQRPGSLPNARQQMVGPLALTLLRIPDPARWAGLGKRLDPWPQRRVLIVASFAVLMTFCFASVHGNANDLGLDQSDTRLADAAEAADWSLLEKLLKEGIEDQSPHPDGMTALHWAVYRNHVPSVERLLAAGSDVNTATRYEVTPLSIACQNGKPKIVATLLTGGADVNKTLPGGETPLMIAARTGNAQVIRQLVKAKANVTSKESRGQTALMWAAAAGNSDAVDTLVAAGAEVNAKSKLGFTAMMFAARDGRGEVVQQLLSAGVDVNAAIAPSRSGDRVPRKGSSALTLAVESGHFELAMYLVRQGADPNDQRNGFTPLHAITWVRKPNRGENSDGDPPPRGSGNLTSLQFVRTIVEAGAEVNRRLKSGKGGRAVLNKKDATPFLMAAKTADLPLLKTLIDLGADPTLTNVDGSNAIMACAGVGVRAVGEEAGTESEVIETLDYLLELGVDVNAVDENKETAMHGAAYRNFPRVVEFLAAHGSDPATWNHKNEYGWTPVMIAQGNRPGSFKPSPVTVAALRAAMASE